MRRGRYPLTSFDLQDFHSGFTSKIQGIEVKALRRLIGLRRMTSCSNLGDWLRRMAEVGLRVLSAINSWIVRQMLRRDNREGYTLGVDSTLIEAEKREAIVTYKGFKGYHPLLAGLKELPLLHQRLLLRCI